MRILALLPNHLALWLFTAPKQHTSTGPHLANVIWIDLLCICPPSWQVETAAWASCTPGGEAQALETKAHFAVMAKLTWPWDLCAIVRLRPFANSLPLISSREKKITATVALFQKRAYYKSWGISFFYSLMNRRGCLELIFSISGD